MRGLTDQDATLTLTDEPAEPVDHAVDAGDISWSIDITEPTVTHTIVLPVDHAVDAVDINWTMEITEPSVTHTSAFPQDHAVDAGDISWSIDITEPTVTLNDAVTPVNTLQLWVDWEGDGSFSHAESNVSQWIQPGTLSAKRGIRFGSRSLPRAIAGNLNCRLWNLAHRFTPDSPASIIPGVRFEGKRVQLRIPFGASSYKIMWHGFMDDVRARNRRSTSYLILTAMGALSIAGVRRVNIAPQQNITTADAMAMVATQLGLRILTNPNATYKTMPWWWVNDEDGIIALRELEETEGGFISEVGGILVGSSTVNDLRFDEADAEISRYATERSVFSDTPQSGELSIINVEEQQAVEYAFNTVIVPVSRYQEGVAAVLWEGPSPITLLPGQTIRINAVYPHKDAPVNHIAAIWTDLEAGHRLHRAGLRHRDLRRRTQEYEHHAEQLRRHRRCDGHPGARHSRYRGGPG